jgi:N-acetylglucosamine-6-phosphate deacetylase
MMTTKLTNCTIVTPHEVIPSGALLFDTEQILALGRTDELNGVEADRELDCLERIVTPGLIDVQVNGGGGHMFSIDINRSAYEEILRAHASLGTTALCPTIISGPIEDMAASISLAADFAGNSVEGQARVAGIHVEGPFLSPAKRGGHAAEHLREPSVDVMGRLLDAGRGHVRIVTLAPELPGAEHVIRYLRSRGVFVSIGHSKATAEEALSAYRWGAMGATHLFNAMEGMTSRAPGGVGATLAVGDIYAGLIADMLHVAPASVLASIRAKGADRMYLTTDAVSPLGSTAQSFDLYGVRVRVRDGGCYTDDGVLAGTATPLSRMVRNLVRDLGLGISEVVGMATRVPAEVLGLKGTDGTIGVGARSDVVIWSADLAPASVWIGGHENPDGSEFL